MNDVITLADELRSEYIYDFQDVDKSNLSTPLTTANLTNRHECRWHGECRRIIDNIQ
jgi:hypothetical protein